jgi:hypothetical protein
MVPSLASSSSDYGARTSYASSVGEPFRYENYDTGLGIIGEEAKPSSFYGDVEIHLVRDDEDETGFNYYGGDDYEKKSARRQMETREIRRASTISTGNGVVKCALDYEIEAYLAELKRTQQSEASEKKTV